MLIHDDRAAGVTKLRVAAHSIHADHISLIFNGARLEQADPVMNPLNRPVGDDREEVRLMRRCGLAEDFGKAQVVTHKRRDRPIEPTKNNCPFARCVAGGLAAKGEWAHLRVIGQQLALRRENQRLVPCAPVASAHGCACDQANAELLGRARKKLLRRSAIRLCNGVRVHAEAGGEHFRQQHQRIFLGRRGAQQAADPVEVGLFIFPRDVEWNGDDVHTATLSRSKAAGEACSPSIGCTRLRRLRPVPPGDCLCLEPIS